MNELQVELKAKIDLQDKHGETALHWAAYKGYTDTVMKLLEGKAKIDLQDRTGRTALYWAAFYGHISIVRQLLGYGGNKDILNNSGNKAMISVELVAEGVVVGNRLQGKGLRVVSGM